MTEKRRSLIKQIWEALESGKKKMRWGTIEIKHRTDSVCDFYSVVYVGGRFFATYSKDEGFDKPIFIVFGEGSDYKVFRELTDEAIEYANQNIDRLKADISERADNSWKASESWKRCRRAAQIEEKRYNRILI